MEQTVPSTLPLRRTTPLDPPPECPAHRAAGIHRVMLPTGRPAWLASRYEDIRALATDPRISSFLHGLGTVSHEELPHQRPGMPPHINNLDGAEHMRFRQSIARHFTTRRIRQLTENITDTVASCFAEMRRRGPGVDLVETLALRVPLETICRLFGLSLEDQATFEELAKLALGGFAKTEEEQREAGPRMFEYLGKVVRTKHDHPDEALFSDLVHGGYGFTDTEVLILAGTLVVAGFDTTAHMLSLGSLALMRNRHQWDLLRAEPQRAEAAADELMRYLTVMQRGLLRRAAEDITIDGVTIPADDLVLLYLPAGNRDPEFVANPDRLDITRPPMRHLGFGYGSHQCIGQQLARLELSTVFAGLVTEFPELRPAVPDEQLEFRSETVVYGLERLPVTW